MTDEITIDKNASNVYQQTRPIGIGKAHCLAPSTSLYFSRDGCINTCCYNRKYALGHYPDQLPSEVWNSPKLMKLRQQFNAGQLVGGCEGCAEQIEAGNLENTLAKNFDRYAEFSIAQLPARLLKAGIRGGSDFWNQLKVEGRRVKYSPNTSLRVSPFPKLLEFELSNICNLECAMCFGEFSSSIRRNREQLPPFPELYDARFVKDINIFLPHIWEAKFYGGEPFLIPIYYELWDNIRALNPKARIHITSNGTILNQKVKSVLKDLNVQLILSIDSFEPETYEAIRKNADYSRVMDHLKYFDQVQKEKNRTITISICPTVLNAHEIPAMVERCNKEGWHLYFNTVWWPEELSLRKLPRKWLDELIAQYQEAAQRATNPTSINQVRLTGLINQLISWRDARTEP